MEAFGFTYNDEFAARASLAFRGFRTYSVHCSALHKYNVHTLTNSTILSVGTSATTTRKAYY